MKRFTEENLEKLERARRLIAEADAVIVGAGAGLSTAAGYVYTGERFERFFGDFAGRYGFRDMYSGGFYPYPTLEEHWAYWSRYIYINRYMDVPKPVYDDLFRLVGAKDHFVLSTNVDHCFHKAGFARERLFCTQGDYGLFQCSEPCRQETFYNAETVREMVLAQGYAIAANGELLPPENGKPAMTVPQNLVPFCPYCGKPMSMNLRADDTFVQDAEWYIAAENYESYLKSHLRGRVVFLELGVGYNTPGIIKYPFWRYTYSSENASYICINLGRADIPAEIKEKSIGFDADIGEVLTALLQG